MKMGLIEYYHAGLVGQCSETQLCIHLKSSSTINQSVYNVIAYHFYFLFCLLINPKLIKYKIFLIK